MKKIFILLSMLFVIFLFSCDNKKTEETTPVAKTYTVKMIYDESLPITTEFLLTLDTLSSKGLWKIKLVLKFDFL